MLMKLKPIRLGAVTLPNNVVMAPLAGHTSYPFRMLCQELGAGLCFTEMVSANALKYQDQANRQLLFTTPQEHIKAVQLLGGDPQVMERAACMELLQGFDLIDINMGCPVPNVFKSGQGSALLGDFPRAEAIIRGCRRSGKPVSVKCRIGIREHEPVIAEFARMCQQAGADMITIHGRSRSMMYAGKPYFDQIQLAKMAVSIPVLANGGISSVEDAQEMLERTGADGVMIGRYALENPFIFSRLTGRPITKGRYTILREQMQLVSRHYDETFALTYLKSLAAYLMKKQAGTKAYKQRMYQCGNLEELDQVLWAAFGEEEVSCRRE